MSEGEYQTILGLVGDTTKVDMDLVASLDIVDSVKRVTEPFKCCNRKFHPEDTVVEVGDVKIGGGNFWRGLKDGGDRMERVRADHMGMLATTINALAVADVGMAVGSGVDVSAEAGDIVLMRGGMDAVLTALALSRATMRNIRQNLGWAFGYNLLGLPVAAGLLHVFGGPMLSPMIAGTAMALSSFSVVSNALRLRFFKV